MAVIQPDPARTAPSGEGKVTDLFVKAHSFGETFNDVNASAAVPEVFLHNGAQTPTLGIQYDIPSASSYDWSAGLVKTRPRFLANRNSDRSAAIALRSWWPCSGSSTAWTSAEVTSRRWP